MYSLLPLLSLFVVSAALQQGALEERAAARFLGDRASEEFVNVDPTNSRSEDPFMSSSAIRSFRENGLCFATTMEDVVKANWNLIDTDFQRGRERAKQTTILFAGNIRNAEASVVKSYKAILWIGQKFKDYHILVYENDSKDKTPSYMNAISVLDSKYDVKTEILNTTNERFWQPSRVRRMATVRNKVHDWVAEFLRSSSQHWDLVALYDFDLNGFGWDAFSPHSFFATLGRKESVEDKWDMICANGLRHRRFNPNGAVGFHDCFAFRADGYEKPTPKYCFDNLSRSLFNQYDLVPVQSCFGGLAFYNPDRFLQCRYDPDVFDCEHVSLHNCMNDRGSKGRMFMDPLLNTLYDPYLTQTCAATAASMESAPTSASPAEQQQMAATPASPAEQQVAAASDSSTSAAPVEQQMAAASDSSTSAASVEHREVGRHPTTMPTAALTGVPTGVPVSAKGDPHLVNIYGQRFDILKPGVHMLIHVPKQETAHRTLLKVAADTRQMGGACADMYFQTMNITGNWVPDRGGLHFKAWQKSKKYAAKWMRLGEVRLKVVWGRTGGGIEYLNFYVKGLNHMRFRIGGLLGEDDHTHIAKPLKECRHVVSL